MEQMLPFPLIAFSISQKKTDCKLMFAVRPLSQVPLKEK